MGRKKAFCEAEVLEKALQLFHKNGFESVSIQDLVNELGISRSSLYETYGSKNDLFIKVLKTYRNQNAKQAIHQLKSVDNANEAIKKFFYDSLFMSCNDPDKKGCLMINSILDASKNLNPSVSQIINDNKREFTNILAEVLQNGQDQGSINTLLNPQDTATLLFALHSGLIANSRIERDFSVLMRAVETGLEILEPTR